MLVFCVLFFTPVHVPVGVHMHHLLPLSAVHALPFSALVLTLFTAGRALPLITAGRGLVRGGWVFFFMIMLPHFSCLMSTLGMLHSFSFWYVLSPSAPPLPSSSVCSSFASLPAGWWAADLLCGHSEWSPVHVIFN